MIYVQFHFIYLFIFFFNKNSLLAVLLLMEPREGWNRERVLELVRYPYVLILSLFVDLNRTTFIRL